MENIFNGFPEMPSETLLTEAKKYYEEKTKKNSIYTSSDMFNFLDSDQKEIIMRTLNKYAKDGNFPKTFISFLTLIKKIVFTGKIIAIVPMPANKIKESFKDDWFICITSETFFPFRIYEEIIDRKICIGILNTVPLSEPIENDAKILGSWNYSVVVSPSKKHFKLNYIGVQIYYKRYDDEYHKDIVSSAIVVYEDGSIYCERSEDRNDFSFRFTCKNKELYSDPELRSKLEVFLVTTLHKDVRSLGKYFLKFTDDCKIPQKDLSFSFKVGASIFNMQDLSKFPDDYLTPTYCFDKGELINLSYIEKKAWWYMDTVGDWEYEDETIRIEGTAEDISIEFHMKDSKELFYNMHMSQMRIAKIVNTVKEKIKKYFPHVQMVINDNPK